MGHYRLFGRLIKSKFHLGSYSRLISRRLTAMVRVTHRCYSLEISNCLFVCRFWWHRRIMRSRADRHCHMMPYIYIHGVTVCVFETSQHFYKKSNAVIAFRCWAFWSHSLVSNYFYSKHMYAQSKYAAQSCWSWTECAIWDDIIVFPSSSLEPSHVVHSTRFNEWIASRD